MYIHFVYIMLSFVIMCIKNIKQITIVYINLTFLDITLAAHNINVMLSFDCNYIAINRDI